MAVILACVLVLGRTVDARRDHAQGMLIDVLHLSAQVELQDAARWRSVAMTNAGAPSMAAALAPETQVAARLDHLRRLGMAGSRLKALSASMSDLDVDLNELAGSAVGTDVANAQADQVSAAVVAAEGALDAESKRLKEAETSGDYIIDVGSAVALLLPAAGAVGLLAWRRWGFTSRLLRGARQ